MGTGKTYTIDDENICSALAASCENFKSKELLSIFIQQA